MTKFDIYVSNNCPDEAKGYRKGYWARTHPEIMERNPNVLLFDTMVYSLSDDGMNYIISVCGRSREGDWSSNPIIRLHDYIIELPERAFLVKPPSWVTIDGYYSGEEIMFASEIVGIIKPYIDELGDILSDVGYIDYSNPGWDE